MLERPGIRTSTRRVCCQSLLSLLVTCLSDRLEESETTRAVTEMFPQTHRNRAEKEARRRLEGTVTLLGAGGLMLLLE